jgi:carboxyl-terminal processing protease
MGERTFGKGTVQNLVDLSTFMEGPKVALGELKMTIAEFYRINGTSTQLLGVTPDIPFPDQGNEALFGESSYDNALPNSHIAAVAFERNPPSGLTTADIVRLHEARVAHSSRWALMLDELKAFRHVLSVKSESLNLAERKAARDTDLAAAKGLRARHLAIDASEGVHDADDASAIEGDDGLIATERKLPAQRPAAKANPATDAQLQEAAQIVADKAPTAAFFAHGIRS